jgi:O-methyltransferase domain/Dimerisation domain
VIAPSPNSDAARRLTDSALGFAPAMMIHAAAQTGVFDILYKEPKTLPELAQAIGGSERALRFLLEGLLSLRIVERHQAHFSLPSETAAFLVRGKPDYVGHLGQMAADWVRLPEIVWTGKPLSSINRPGQGGEYFLGLTESLFQMHSQAAAVFADALATQWKLASHQPLNILDVAAGSGIWGIAAAKRLPQSRLTAIDWPKIIPATEHYARANGLADRFRGLPGDIHGVDFGTQNHLVILGHILHSEGEAGSRRLITKAAASLVPGGLLAITEYILNDDRSGPSHAACFALTMLMLTDSGDVFTFPQIRQWLTDANLKTPSLSQLPNSNSLITAMK